MSAELFLPCSFCGGATPHATLATYGARCMRCFDEFCARQSAPPENPQGRRKAFMPRQAVAKPTEPVALPPAVPMPLAAAPIKIPETEPAPSAETMEEPPAWATQA